MPTPTVIVTGVIETEALPAVIVAAVTVAAVGTHALRVTQAALSSGQHAGFGSYYS